MREELRKLKARFDKPKSGEVMGFLLRPIQDRCHRHSADRLTPSHPPGPADDLEAFAQAVAITIFQLNECNRIGFRDLFIDLPIEAFDYLEPVPFSKNEVILSLPNDWQVDDTSIDIIRRARSKGYRTEAPAPSLFDCDPEIDKLFSVARVSGVVALRDDKLTDLSRRGIKLLADSILHQEDIKPFFDRGFDYFDTRYLANLEPVKSDYDHYHDSKEVHLHLIRELSNDDAQLCDLENILLQMPETHLSILKLANSVKYRRGDFARYNLRQSIQILGFTMLRRLIMVLSLTDETPESRLKMRMALTRAFMSRCIAKNMRKNNKSQAFDVGLFSMIGSLLNAPQEDIIDEMPLDDEMRKALVSRAGSLGVILNLVESHEQGLSGPGAADFTRGVSKCYMESIIKTEELLGLL